jgi:hypothetical protein
MYEHANPRIVCDVQVSCISPTDIDEQRTIRLRDRAAMAAVCGENNPELARNIRAWTDDRDEGSVVSSGAAIADQENCGATPAWRWELLNDVVCAGATARKHAYQQNGNNHAHRPNEIEISHGTVSRQTR